MRVAAHVVLPRLFNRSNKSLNKGHGYCPGSRRAFTVAREISGGEQLSGILHRREHRRQLRASRIQTQLLGQTAATRLPCVCGEAIINASPAR